MNLARQYQRQLRQEQNTRNREERVQARIRVKCTSYILPTVNPEATIVRGGEDTVVEMYRSEFERHKAMLNDDASLFTIAAEQLKLNETEFLTEYVDNRKPNTPAEAELYRAEALRAFPGSIQAEYRKLARRDPSPIEVLEELRALPPLQQEAHVDFTEQLVTVATAAAVEAVKTLMAQSAEGKSAKK
jgi:hypothetical protein